MLGKEKLERINELARKLKSGTLTQEEVEEQSMLRKEYVRAFRSQFEGHLQAIGAQGPQPRRSHNCSCGCGHKH